MSDNEIEDFLNFYSAKSTSSIFKKQLNKISKNPLLNDNGFQSIFGDSEFNCEINGSEREAPPAELLVRSSVNERLTVNNSISATLTENTPLSEKELITLKNDSDVECIDVSQSEKVGRYYTRSKGTHVPKRNSTLKPLLPKKKRKPQRKTEDEVIIISKPLNTSIEEDEFNYIVPVKVLWMSVNVVKFNIRKFQKLDLIYDHFTREKKLNRDEILLTFHGVELNEGDTPGSLNITVLDFIEGGVIKSNKKSSFIRSDACGLKGDFILKIQSELGIKSISVNPKEQMKVIMTKFSEQVNKPYGSFAFKFEGDKVQATDTPLDLGIENGDILDVMAV